jgi:Bacterial extracellular solute-binding protein
MNEAMMVRRGQRWAPGLMLGISLAVTVLGFQSRVSAQAGPPQQLTAIPPNRDTDLKFYQADGQILNGVEALEHMTSDANLVVWVAGNQFFAMDDVIGALQKAYPGVTVGLLTLPPGLLLSAVLAGGWLYKDRAYRGGPDIYATVDTGHLQRLKAAGLMQNYEIYMHNELQMIVTKGNPKAIVGIDDLVRGDVRTSLPNPVNEGIMQFYARGVLERTDSGRRLRTGRNACPAKPRSVIGSPRYITGKPRSAFGTINPTSASSGRRK